MATRQYSLVSAWIFPGLLNAILLVSITILTFFELFLNAPDENYPNLFQDQYLQYMVIFSFSQALLSALLSVILAIPLAYALWRRRFPGRKLLLRLYSMTLVLPVLVAVLGLLSIYGREGWLAQICTLLGIEYHFSPYGLQGILLAHVFFNLPLATRLLLQSMENIPIEQRQLSTQLNICGRYFFYLIIWPWIRRQIFPTLSLIFILCFSSFAIVLVLGGGPNSTTIELAIFQAVHYDYDPKRAAMLASLQMIFYLILVVVSKHFSKTLPISNISLNEWRIPNYGIGSLIRDTLMIMLAVLLLLPPLLAVLLDAIQQGVGNLLNQHSLWNAVWTSIRIALPSGILSVLLTVSLLWSSCELRFRKYVRIGQALEISGMLILSIPSFVLGTSFFLLFNSTFGIPEKVDGIVIFTNALMAIPFSMRILEYPMRDTIERYQYLCLSLNILGWYRAYLIVFKALKQPLAQALAFSCVLSIGDFGIVALFGNTEFRTLPLYLYQQISTYRNSDGSVTAMLLLLLCFILFTLIEKLLKNYANFK